MVRPRLQPKKRPERTARKPRRLWFACPMGEEVNSKRYTPEERTLYREKLAENLELFDTYLRHAEFKSAGTIGLELELNLVDGENQPSLRNKDVLARLDDEYQSEIGGFNLELNHPVLQVAGRGLKTLEAGVAHRLERVQRAEIGRASGRERGQVAEVAAAAKRRDQVERDRTAKRKR